MPRVTIDGRTLEVEAGTNLVDAAARVGVQIPHYCYHPRLSVVGQCRMCLVAVEGAPKLQAACSTQVTKDGMSVRTDTEEVSTAQRAMMEFLLVNHPLDCPICDQAGECGLQDYAFEHGVAFSRYRFEDKRTYPGRERIPLGPDVVLNMNRCIQCTRCVRFTREISGGGELGFFDRGARTEIGVFPGHELTGDLAGNVVDICPVGALTSRRFRFAERVWYLDKKPSLCTGCDVGCNVTIEHRRGKIKRYKPRYNPEVNDYWMCDFGRASHERYRDRPRLAAPRQRGDGEPRALAWEAALDDWSHHLRTRGRGAQVGFLATGELATEEAYLLAKLAERAGATHRGLVAGRSKPFHIPNPSGGITGHDDAPNRRGLELAGFADAEGGAADAAAILAGDLDLAVLVVADSELGHSRDETEVAERLRRAAQYLVVLGWADTPLARLADLALPVATHAEKDGTFVNVEHRLQRFRPAFPPPGEARPTVEALLGVLARFEREWEGLDTAAVFARMSGEIEALTGLSFDAVPPLGVPLRPREAGAA